MSDINSRFPRVEDLIAKHDDYSRKWILEGGIVKNCVNIFAAERGTGKTRFMLSMATAYRYCNPEFAGYKLMNFGDVLYLNFEISEAEFTKMYEPIFNWFEQEAPPQKAYYDLKIWSCRSRTDFTLMSLSHDVIQLNPALIIIDSFKAFGNFFMRDKGISKLDNDSMTEMYKLFYEWQERCEAAIVLINHTNKGTSDKPSHSDLMYGAGTLIDLADMTLIMRKTRFKSQTMVIPDKSRYAAEGFLGSNVLEIMSDDPIEPKRLWFELIEKDIDESDYMPEPFKAKTSRYSQEQKSQVHDLLRTNKSLREIACITGISKSTISNWKRDIN